MSAAIEQEARELFTFGQVDHKAWAKRILYRLDRGDKSLLAIQIQFAREALNQKEEVTG